MPRLLRDDVEDLNTFDQLELPEKLLIWGIRSWVACCKAQICPVGPLRLVFSRYNVAHAAASVDALLSITAQSAARGIEVHCPNCSQISSEPSRLRRFMSWTQQKCSCIAGWRTWPKWLLDRCTDWQRCSETQGSSCHIARRRNWPSKVGPVAARPCPRPCIDFTTPVVLPAVLGGANTVMKR